MALTGDISVEGVEGFVRLSKALKAAGEKELRRELHTAMRRTARPLVPLVRASARANLPQRGGLAAQVAKEPVRVKVATGRTPGVHVVVGRKGGGARATNRGVVSHPVFGDRSQWVTQEVPQAARWFDDVMEAQAPVVRHNLDVALAAMADEVVRRVGGR